MKARSILASKSTQEVNVELFLIFYIFSIWVYDFCVLLFAASKSYFSSVLSIEKMIISSTSLGWYKFKVINPKLRQTLSGSGIMWQSHSPSVVERDWLLRRSEGLKRVRSLKLQLFCTLAGLVPSVPGSATGDRRSFTDEACLFLMLWPRGLANLTRSLKLNFWLESEIGMNSGTEGSRGWGEEQEGNDVVRRWNDMKIG